jgi:PAS domain S-box-containing protein
VLVAVALLPATAIQGYNEFDRRRARQLEVQDHARGIAQLAAADQQQIVQGIRQVLIALSELPSIKSRDSLGCTTYLGAIKQRFPAFITIIVTDTKGLSFCHTDGKQVDVSQRAYFTQALGTGAFTVGEFSIGLSSNRNVIQFALPFYDHNGSMGGVIIASLGLDWLGDYVARKASEGAALAVTDFNGTYLARYPDNDRFVGTKMPGFKHLTVGGWDVVDIVDVDGIQRIESSASLPDGSGGLAVSFGLNKAQAFAEIQRETLRDTFLIFLSTTLVLALASLGARQFIHRPLGQLIDASNQWRLGKFSRRVDIGGNGEIAVVAEAFNTMADALAYREQELSKAKDVAEEAAARITTIFESTNDSVLIVDRDWRISYLNGPAWASVAEGHDIAGKTLFEAFQDDLKIEVLHQIEERISEQQAAFVEVYCPHRNIWYAINAFPSSEGFAIFFRDITEHKHALEARHQIEEQLHQSQKMESVGQLTGGVAHDFNNLLTVVSGNLELVEAATDVREVRKFAAAAQRAIDRGTKLTAQLLSFSRRQTLSPKVFNANQRISEFQELVRQAVGAGYEVTLQTDSRLWLCDVDPSLLETALLNLVLNARDAMPDGGLLQIETRNIVVEEGALAGCLAGPYVRLSVTDTGCGIPPEVRDRVFEPFFTTKGVGKGTGLGLSMVYGFVRQSGGHVAIESAPKEGTTISLYLPKATQEPEAVEEARQALAITPGSERILLVDDNNDILEVTSEMLRIRGYQVSCARSGSEALRMLQSDQTFELLLTDIVMPNGMSGVELARGAKRLRRGIKILLTSGYARDVLQRHNAVDEFPIIRKPFRFIELAQRLRAVLECTRSSSENR